MVTDLRQLFERIVDNYSHGVYGKVYRDEFMALSSSQKNLVLQKLSEYGMPQKEIAVYFSISASAVSQRLRPSPSSNFLAHVKRLEDLRNAGFSSQSIASLLNESGVQVSSQDLEAFFKVKNTLDNF